MRSRPKASSETIYPPPSHSLVQKRSTFLDRTTNSPTAAALLPSTVVHSTAVSCGGTRAALSVASSTVTAGPTCLAAVEVAASWSSWSFVHGGGHAAALQSRPRARSCGRHLPLTSHPSPRTLPKPGSPPLPRAFPPTTLSSTQVPGCWLTEETADHAASVGGCPMASFAAVAPAAVPPTLAAQ